MVFIFISIWIYSFIHIYGEICMVSSDCYYVFITLVFIYYSLMHKSFYYLYYYFVLMKSLYEEAYLLRLSIISLFFLNCIVIYIPSYSTKCLITLYAFSFWDRSKISQHTSFIHQYYTSIIRVSIKFIINGLSINHSLSLNKSNSIVV